MSIGELNAGDNPCVCLISLVSEHALQKKNIAIEDIVLKTLLIWLKTASFSL